MEPSGPVSATAMRIVKDLVLIGSWPVLRSSSYAAVRQSASVVMAQAGADLAQGAA